MECCIFWTGTLRALEVVCQSELMKLRKASESCALLNYLANVE